MADQSINMLPVSDGLTDDGLLVVYQESAARSIRGALVKEYAREAAAGSVSAAGSAAAQAAKSAQEAKGSADRAQAVVVNAPKIVGTTWWVYDKTVGKYVDTGVEAQGPVGPKGEVGPAGPQGIQGPQGPQGIAGVAVATSGIVAFNVTEDGILQCSYTGDEQPNYYINADGHLVLEI